MLEAKRLHKSMISVEKSAELLAFRSNAGAVVMKAIKSPSARRKEFDSEEL